MKPCIGTPKTLEDAVFNGLVAAVRDGRSETPTDQVQIMADHIRDYFRQHFATAYLRMNHAENPFGVLKELAEKTGVAPTFRVIPSEPDIEKRIGDVHPEFDEFEEHA